MYTLRCIGVSLAFFLALYCAISLLVVRTWTLAERLGRALPPRRKANLLLALRLLPVCAAASITALFVLPSFLLLEPRAAAEPVGEVPLLLSACCMVLLAVGLRNALRAQARTSQAVSAWLHGATPVPSGKAIPVYRIRPAVPALTVAGVCAPRVLVSEAAAALLSPAEFHIALEHELAHVRHRDNLKKLAFRFAVFPGMAPLEAAWSEAGEMAADDAAVSSAATALDLASALIKLSRLAPMPSSAALATGLVQGSAASLNARVERLVKWAEQCRTPRGWPWSLLPAGIGTCVLLACTYSTVLAGLHEATEWLVR